MQTGGPPATHPLVWASAAACGATVAVAGLLDGFTVAIDAYIGAGNSQRILPPFERTYTLLGYGHPRYLAAYAAALAAVGAAAWGWRPPAAWAPIAAILGAAIVGLSLTSAALQSGNGPAGGVFLSDAVEESRRAARQIPAARHPEFGQSGYSADPALGWQLTQGALYALLAISSIALGRRIRRVAVLAIAAAVAAAILVSAVPGANCGGADEITHDPDSNPLGLLAVFAGLACAGLGLGALSRRAWLHGVLAVAAGLVIAPVAALILAARDCAFY